MLRCYYCQQDTVYIENSFSFQDYGVNENGLVQIYSCGNCGASIEFWIPFNGEEEDNA